MTCFSTAVYIPQKGTEPPINDINFTPKTPGERVLVKGADGDWHFAAMNADGTYWANVIVLRA